MRIAAALLALAISGCANHERQLQELGAGVDGAFMPYLSGPLPVQTWLPAGQHQHLQVFIEGDGHAFVTSSRASTDPTPSKPVILQLALSERSAYLGRPCQYVTNSHCKPSEWTDRRFSQSALESMSGALDVLKSSAGAESLDLVGYSGGGAMALLLAATREDVSSVQTIAGNVAPTFWASSKGFTPLTGSLDPLAYREKLAGIPQRHLVGDSDKVITRAVVTSYLQALPHSRCAEVVPYHGDHWTGLSAAWRRYGASAVACRK